MQIEVLKYTGTGASNPVATSFAYDLFITKGNTTQNGQIRSRSMATDSSKDLIGANNTATNIVTAMGSTTITLGTSAKSNSNGISYISVGVRDDGNNDFAIGSYVGNGSSGKTIALGFDPCAVFVWSAGATNVIYADTQSTSTKSQYMNAAEITTGIIALSTGGGNTFTVGTDSSVNTNGTTYFYAAFKAVSNVCEIVGWAGNSVDNTNISTTTDPQWVMAKRLDSVDPAALRNSLNSGDESSQVGAAAWTTNIIQGFSLSGNGFQVGTDSKVNTTGHSYHALVLRAPSVASGFFSRFQYDMAQRLVNV